MVILGFLLGLFVGAGLVSLYAIISAGRDLERMHRD